MSTLAVAKKDFLDVRRSKIIWLVGGLYIAVIMLFLYFGQKGVPDPDVQRALGGLTGIGGMIIPLIALVSAYLAIAGERESGSMKYLLSIPNSRRDVVLGKFLSRSLIVSASIAISFLLGIGLMLMWYPAFDLGTVVSITSLIILYALSYVAVAIGISAATASRSRAMGGAIGFFFVTNVLNLFGPLKDAITFLFNDLAGLGISDAQITFVQVLISPTAAYLKSIPLVFSNRPTPQNEPWFLQSEISLIILLAWVVVPIAFGIWQFKRTDLG